jgi:hypothetical protein
MPDVTVADVQRLAGVLDGVELSDEDRGVLHAVFTLAGQAANDRSEVSAFGSDSAIIFVGGSPRLGGGLFRDFLNPQPLPPSPPPEP